MPGEKSKVLKISARIQSCSLSTNHQSIYTEGGWIIFAINDFYPFDIFYLVF